MSVTRCVRAGTFVVLTGLVATTPTIASAATPHVTSPVVDAPAPVAGGRWLTRAPTAFGARGARTMPTTHVPATSLATTRTTLLSRRANAGQGLEEKNESRVARAAEAVGRGFYQAGGLALGVGEKALGRHAPDFGGPFHMIEVKPPAGSDRSLVVFRTNQARNPEEFGEAMKTAEAHGAKTPSQVLFVNLRSEHDQDAELISQFQAKAPPDSSNRVRQLNVPLLDNAPPAFFVGNFGWNRAVAKIGTVYRAMKDPNVKVAFIHCDEGKGRTGEVVATAVRVAMDDMSEKDAIAEAEAHGLTMPWQKAFVVRFAREWHAGKIHFDEPAAPAAR